MANGLEVHFVVAAVYRTDQLSELEAEQCHVELQGTIMLYPAAFNMKVSASMAQVVRLEEHFMQFEKLSEGS